MYIHDMYFISGVNGVGKTSIIPYLKKILQNKKYEIHDFDERGVPINADGKWRKSETRYWVETGAQLARENRAIVVCGFVKPADFEDLLSDKSLDIHLILLDAQPKVIRERLLNRYTKDGYFDTTQTVIGKPIDVFINGNIYILEQMRVMFEELHCPIIDTSDLSPEVVAVQVVKCIQSA